MKTIFRVLVGGAFILFLCWWFIQPVLNLEEQLQEIKEIYVPATEVENETDPVKVAETEMETATETETEKTAEAMGIQVVYGTVIENPKVVAVEESDWDGPVLNKVLGTVQGPSGKETFYNLDMSGVVEIMRKSGYDYTFWIREDGVKMYGDYVMCAADLNLRPRGTILPTSLGMGMVCDTGTFIYTNPEQLDIAVAWEVA